MSESYGLVPEFVERIWGKTDLRPWYEVNGEEKIGEAWLTGPGCRVGSGAGRGERFDSVAPGYPLLVKMLFPDEKLSVQVHPDDAEARALGMERGKTECWYVLEAEAGAKVACGLRAGVTVEDLRAGVEDETAENLMEWLPVSVGEMVFVDAGTVHAIGPGVTLLEVQQTSDVTYRLYDYGRPRELHLEAGLRVVKTKTRAGKVAARVMDGFTRLIEEQYFVVDRYEGAAEVGAGCVVALAGKLVVDGVEVEAGTAVVCPVGARVEGVGVFVRCWVP